MTHFLAEKFEGTNSSSNISSWTAIMSKTEALSLLVTMSSSIGGVEGEVVMMNSKNNLAFISFVAEL